MSGYLSGIWRPYGLFRRDNKTVLPSGWFIKGADGTLLQLSANGVQVIASNGTGLPDPENVTARYALIDGGVFQRRMFAPRQFSLICELFGGAGLKGIHSLRQKLIKFMSVNDDTDIQIIYSGYDKSVYIDCRYVSGLNLGERLGYTEKVGLTFLAVKPLWYETVLYSRQISSSVAQTVNYISQDKSLMNGGLDNVPKAIFDLGGYTYAFGSFTNYGRKYNGTWSNIGDKPRDAVLQAVKDNDNTVYAVGNSKIIEMLSEGSQVWGYLGISQPNGAVYATCVDSGGNTYIGGSFTQVSGVMVSNIAKWDGLSWSDMSGGINGTIYGLCANGTDIYIVGDFLSANGLSGANYIVKYDGAVYSLVGTASSVNGITRCVAFESDDLYIGGDFTTPTTHIARLTVTGWDGLLSCSDTVTAITSSSYGLFAVSPLGTFSFYSVYSNNMDALSDINTWDDVGTWDTPPDLVNGSAKITRLNGSYEASLDYGALVPYSCYATNTELYIGHATGLLKWNGSYTTLITTNAPIYSITVIGSDVYFGGNFTHNISNYLLRYNSGQFYKVTDLNNTVQSLYSHNNQLFIGGNFTEYLLTYYNYRLYSLFYSSVIKTIVIDGLYGYIGGDFGVVRVTLATGQTVYLSGLSNVNSVSFMGSVYAGGSFSENVKRWNGTAWVSVDGGTNGEVYQLATDGSTLYMIGDFEVAGGEVACGGIARLINNVWVNFGTGINTTTNTIKAILVKSPSEIYVTGDFLLFSGVTLTIPVIKFNGSKWVEHLDDYESNDSVISCISVENNVTTLSYESVAHVTFFGDVIQYNGTAKGIPQLILSGVGSVSSFRNTTTDAYVSFNDLTLSAGDIVTLDLDPTNMTFTKLNYGITLTDIIGKISFDSTPSSMRLKPGANSIRVIADGTITAVIKWRNYHWSIDGVSQ